MLGLYLLLSVFALAAIMIGSSFYFSWLTRRMVINTLREIDDIRTDGRPPHYWMKLGRGGDFTEKDWIRQKKRNLKKLDGLVKYIKRTTLVEDEETRRGVLVELSVIRQEWEAEEWPGR